MKRIAYVSLVLIAAIVAAACGRLPGGQESVAEAGSISGTIVYEGKPPRMRPIAVDADPTCAKLHADEPLFTEWLLLGEGQTVANVFVQVVSGLPEGKTYPMPEGPADFTQKDCRYSPHVLAVRAGQTVRILNPDAMQHNVHAMPETNREFNKAMAKTVLEVTHNFPKAESPFKIKCDVHGWMEAYCVVVEHPFYAVTESDGSFKIEGLDAGEYEIEAWHEVLGTRRATVKVSGDEDAVADFTFTRPQKK